MPVIGGRNSRPALAAVGDLRGRGDLFRRPARAGGRRAAPINGGARRCWPSSSSGARRWCAASDGVAYLRDRLSPWVPVSHSGSGAVGVAAMMGGGAIVVAIGLLIGRSTTRRRFPCSPRLGPVAASEWPCWALPIYRTRSSPERATPPASASASEAVPISPFGSTPTELPAVTLLTAVPDHAVASRWLLVVFLVPLLAAVLIGRAAHSAAGPA